MNISGSTKYKRLKYLMNMFVGQPWDWPDHKDQAALATRKSFVPSVYPSRKVMVINQPLCGLPERRMS